MATPKPVFFSWCWDREATVKIKSTYPLRGRTEVRLARTKAKYREHKTFLVPESSYFEGKTSTIVFDVELYPYTQDNERASFKEKPC